VLTAFDYPEGTFTIAAIPVVAAALAIGWVVLKGSNPVPAFGHRPYRQGD
jgi:hypothetical protein